MEYNIPTFFLTLQVKIQYIVNRYHLDSTSQHITIILNKGVYC